MIIIRRQNWVSCRRSLELEKVAVSQVVFSYLIIRRCRITERMRRNSYGYWIKLVPHKIVSNALSL